MCVRRSHLLVDVVAHDVGQIVVEGLVGLFDGLLPACGVCRPALEGLPEHCRRAQRKMLALVPTAIAPHVPSKPETDTGGGDGGESSAAA